MIKTRNVFFYCLVVFVISRLWFFAIAIFLNHEHHFHLHTDALFIQLDAKWYLDIIWHGYDKVPKPWDFGRANYVFFPLLPALMKGLIILTHCRPLIAGQVITNGFFLLSLCLFYRLLEQEFGKIAACLGVGLLALSPYNIYFMSIYTESLALALSLGCWLAAKHRVWWLLGVLGFLLSACHPNGVLIFIFALWFAIDDYRQKRHRVWQYWPILFIPLGLASNMFYLHVHVGTALAFLHDERFWSTRTGWHLNGFGQELIDRIKKEPYSFVVYVLALGLSGLLLRMRYYKEALFIPLMTAPALWTGSFGAMGRYTATLFTFYFALVLLWRTLKLKVGASTIIGILAAMILFSLQLWLMYLFLMHSYWVF